MTSRDISVIGQIASNLNTPVGVLEQLSTDENDWVRNNVASNPNTPVDLLEQLSTDLDEYVCQWVKINPNFKHIKN